MRMVSVMEVVVQAQQPGTGPFFKVQDGLLYRVFRLQEGEVSQLPRTYLAKVLYLSHTHLMVAHLGVGKTSNQISGPVLQAHD